MPKSSNRGLLKPYNIVIDEGGNSARIDMYGEVVANHPVDWWTGEPIPGNFIAQDEFLKDLAELEGKDEVTVHINSVGGDMYAGIAIYNRLKGLAAHVTTINDGLAASAGSLIFMAGDDRPNKGIHWAMRWVGMVNSLPVRLNLLQKITSAGVRAWFTPKLTRRISRSIKHSLMLIL